MSDNSHFTDGFLPARPADAIEIELNGERIVMLIGWRAVREAARDWHRFSSDAPFRVPIPSEEDVRNVRQLPIESDPPLHTEFRSKLEPWFRRPTRDEYLAILDELITREIASAKEAGTIDFVREFALPLQSRALALLLNMPEKAADTWIGWVLMYFATAPMARQKAAFWMTIFAAKLSVRVTSPATTFFPFCIR